MPEPKLNAPGFCQELPADLNALRLPEGGWISRFPDYMGFAEFSADYGDKGFPLDERVLWAARQLRGFVGKTILEIGPLEAYNTLQFEQLGAAAVVSIEASHQNFLKCLIIKNIYSLGARFLLGDAIKFMRHSHTKFDIVWASGILYHLVEPIEFLKNLGNVADKAFIWTHYFDRGSMTEDALSWFDPELDVVVRHDDREIALHYRSYRLERFGGGGGIFSGGSQEFSFWMAKNDIVFLLHKIGFLNIVMGADNLAHPGGPACFFICSRDVDQ